MLHEQHALQAARCVYDVAINTFTEKGKKFFPSFHDFIWLQFQKFLLQSFETSSICSKMWICGASASRCVFSMCVCVRVGLRQNRAAEMRQALQIFVGWLTTPCRCQAPTAETTKRRIRLALEPQIPPHPSFSFLLLFSRSVARRLLWSGSDSIWQRSHCHPWVYQSVFISLWLYGRMEVETWHLNTAGGVQ